MDTFQTLFHQQWSHLKDRHVRSLAWLLFSPDLLDEHSPVWHRQVKGFHFSQEKKEAIYRWLIQLDESPIALHEAIAVHQFLRLGHYAENLLAFYFRHEGLLFVHGLQVHDEIAGTVGEFDFLLFDNDGLSHLEFATKFYLFHPSKKEQSQSTALNFLGPNLNDSLGNKMQKILQQQLALSRHKAAHGLFNARVVEAKALIKGWFFYRSPTQFPLNIDGIAERHCKGYWWTLEEFEHLAISHVIKLDRLDRLAPAQVSLDKYMSKTTMMGVLERHFSLDSSPVLIAIMKINGDVMQEFCRGFVVSNDWESKANLIV
jgi:hypothetical protein